jgi:hypothetical protein
MVEEILIEFDSLSSEEASKWRCRWVRQRSSACPLLEHAPRELEYLKKRLIWSRDIIKSYKYVSFLHFANIFFKCSKALKRTARNGT